MKADDRLKKMQDIIHALENKGITRYRVAQDTHITEASLSHWFSGKKKPNLIYVNIMIDYASKHGVEIA